MARPREFDEAIVLDAVVQCFWRRGYEATTVRDLTRETRLTAASLYNAFGDKRALYQKALDRYVECSIIDRITRCRSLAPYDAISGFFAEILRRSLGDPQHKGCMLVNAALDTAPNDADILKNVSFVLRVIESFFRDRVTAGQTDGTISRESSGDDLARHLLGVLMGVRVLARVRPERALLEGVIGTALSQLTPRPAAAH